MSRSTPEHQTAPVLFDRARPAGSRCGSL